MNTATAQSSCWTALAHEGLLNFDPYAKTYHVGFELAANCRVQAQGRLSTAGI